VQREAGNINVVSREEILKSQSKLKFGLGVKCRKGGGVALFILSVEYRVPIHPH